MERVKHFLGILVAILFLPTIVFADEAYITYSDIKCNGQSVMVGGFLYDSTTNIGEYIEYSMKGQEGSKYSFVITGHDIADDNAEYTLTLVSDFKDFKKTYTGAELKTGITISGEDGNGSMISKIVDKNNKILKNKSTTPDTGITKYFKETKFVFNYNFNTTELDAVYNSMLTNGKIKLNIVDPTDDLDLSETSISVALKEYETERYSIYGNCYEKDKCFVFITDTKDYSKHKEYSAKFEFVIPNMLIKNRNAPRKIFIYNGRLRNN